MQPFHWLISSLNILLQLFQFVFCDLVNENMGPLEFIFWFFKISFTNQNHILGVLQYCRLVWRSWQWSILRAHPFLWRWVIYLENIQSTYHQKLNKMFFFFFSFLAVLILIPFSVHKIFKTEILEWLSTFEFSAATPLLVFSNFLIVTWPSLAWASSIPKTSRTWNWTRQGIGCA